MESKEKMILVSMRIKLKGKEINRPLCCELDLWQPRWNRHKKMKFFKEKGQNSS